MKLGNTKMGVIVREKYLFMRGCTSSIKMLIRGRRS
jgi:hypothetical protein